MQTKNSAGTMCRLLHYATVRADESGRWPALPYRQPNSLKLGYLEKGLVTDVS